LLDRDFLAIGRVDKDAGGKSMCNGRCAENRPTLMTGTDAKSMGDWTVVTRDDGKLMWAYEGKPLCTRLLRRHRLCFEQIFCRHGGIIPPRWIGLIPVEDFR
jgi:hypothetical protein